MLMRTSTHHKMVEADTVKIAEQGSLIRKLTAERDKVFAANLKLASKLRMSEHRYDRLEARLAVFTAPRPRGAGGKFVSTKGAQA